MTKVFSEDEGLIEVSGGTIWYKIAGERNEKTPIVILHGGPGIPHNYLTPLAELKRSVIFYDQLGCGRSTLSADQEITWTTQKFVDDLDAVIDHLGLEQFYLLGHSWGGACAIEYALKFPAKVKGLILASPLVSTSLWVEDSKRLMQKLPEETLFNIIENEKCKTFDNKQYQAACHLFYQNFLCRMEVWPQELMDSLNQLNTSIYHSMWGPSEFTVTGSLAAYSRVSDLCKIYTATLITCGRYDEATPESMQKIARQIPGFVRLKIFEKSSHMAHLEEKPAFLNTVEGFLAEIDRAKIEVTRK